MKKHVFISYSTKDKEVAERIVEYIESKGISCFIAPRDIRAGREYPSEIMRGINECKAAVLVASSAINDSFYVIKELENIVKGGKYLIPFFIENFEPNTSISFYIGEKQWIKSYMGDNIDRYFTELFAAVSGALDDMGNESEHVRPDPIPAPAPPEKEEETKAPKTTQKIFEYLPDRGIMINPEDQQRNVSFRTDTFISMFGNIYDEVLKLSDLAYAEKTFHQSGYNCGNAFAQRLNSHWDLAASGASLYEEKLKKWCEFDSDVGWGKFDIDIDVNEETGDFKGKLVISECFIVDNKNKRHICQFVKGYCVGVIETLLGIEVELVCVTCPLKNKFMKNKFKPSCVFDILIKED